jgi:chemotaxis protein MotB
MGLSRRSGARFQSSIWPGFVDAMTGLLLVLMFVLTIFMVVQFVLTERISGQETELDALSGEVAALARALGLEERSNAQLEARLGALNTSLNDARDEADQQRALIASLSAQRDQQAADLATARTQITGFEAQVAALLSQRDEALGQVKALEGTQAELESAQAELLSEQEALNLALASARTEIDAQAETARLAAARREVLDALVADLQRQNAENETQVANLTREIADGAEALTAEETARLAEAAAAEALRERLENADAELTAMTLALEKQRKDAEDTLTLLAAARAAEGDLDAQLAQALLLLQTTEAQAAEAGGTADARIEALQLQVLNLQTALAETQNSLTADRDTLQSELTLSQQDVAVLKAQLEETRDALSKDRDALAAELTLSKQEVAALTARLVETEEALSANRETLRAELASAQAEVTALKASLAQSQQTLSTDREALRAQLARALAAKLAAETLANDTTTDVQKQAALLAAAQQSLAQEEAVSSEAQRQTELLNQQVAALRTQLGDLQSLLDDAVARDAAKSVELQSLGSDLNTALARVAAEQSRRAELEAAERRRLEEEAKLRAAEAEALQEQAKDLEQYKSEFFGRLREVLGTQDGVRIEGDRFVFSSEVLFAAGAAELETEGQREIAKVASILRAVAGDIPPEIDWVIRVDGHTDSVPLSGTGEFADNWELSQARALSVVKYMINFLAIPPNRLAANGFGQYQPVAAGDSDAARAQNRRIELKFTEK